MTADYKTKITIKGTDEEMHAMIGVLQSYAARNSDVYFSKFTLGKKDADQICYYYNSGKNAMNQYGEIPEAGDELYVTGEGPYGSFGYFEDLSFFEDLAAAAPHAWFQGSISGSNTYTEQSLEAKLTDEQLQLRYSRIEEQDSWDEEDDEEDWDEEDDEEDRDEDDDEEDEDWDDEGYEDRPIIAMITEKTYDPKHRQYVGDVKCSYQQV